MSFQISQRNLQNSHDKATSRLGGSHLGCVWQFLYSSTIRGSDKELLVSSDSKNHVLWVLHSSLHCLHSKEKKSGPFLNENLSGEDGRQSLLDS